MHVLFLFSGPEHQKTDWLGIHEKICQLLIPLRTPIPFLGSEEERQHRKQQQIVRQVFIIFVMVLNSLKIEKKFKNSKYKIVKKISEPFKSQDQISISSYWTWRHSLTDISLSILHNFLQDEKVELQGEVENKSMFGFLQTDTNDWIMPHRGSKVALWR